MTAPSRRSEELARLEKGLSQMEPASSGDDGHKTTVMETMSLVEAERQIAKDTMDGVQSGVREIVAAAPVAPAPVMAAPTTSLAEPPSEILVRAQRRRRSALWVVGAVIGAAVVLIAVSLARGGWSLPGKARVPIAGAQR